MKTSAYCVYDASAETFSLPEFFKNEKLAIRWFKSYIQPGTSFFMFPEEYELVYFGEYDDEVPSLTEDPNKPAVCQAIDIVNEYKERNKINEGQV